MAVAKFCARKKDDFHSVKMFFVPSQKFLKNTKCSQIFGLAQIFGPAQNILGPVKGQGITDKLKLREWE